MLLNGFYVFFCLSFLQTSPLIINIKDPIEESLLACFDKINEEDNVSNEINFEINFTIVHEYRILKNLTIK